jgi:hypothetical protein
MRLHTILFALILTALCPRAGLTQQTSDESATLDGTASDGLPEVLVLGVWHMANRTGDAEDILSAKRQAELPEVMEILKRFQPTKVALENAFYRGDALSKVYADYLDGAHELTRNERQQLGFRLAKELGHPTVYSIDADGDFPLLRLQDYVEANGIQEEYDTTRREFDEWLEVWERYFSSHTLLEALLYMNSDDYAAALMAHDYELAHFGEPWNWAGADLLSDWFQRNARIYSNIVHLTDSPYERVLVIIGAGHLPWLRHNLTNDPNVRLRKLGEFAR